MKNLYFPVLSIDGTLSPQRNSQLRFYRINADTSKEFNALVATVSVRIAWYLERQSAQLSYGWSKMSCSDHLTGDALLAENGDNSMIGISFTVGEPVFISPTRVIIDLRKDCISS